LGGSAALDLADEQIEGALRLRLDQLELRERCLESVDVVSVLYLVGRQLRRPKVAPCFDGGVGAARRRRDMTSVLFFANDIKR
jgi:hypothetical protein